MLLNEKINVIDHKMLWTEAVCACKRVRNSTANTGITKSPFRKFYGEKSKIISLFSEFRRIAYVTKWEKLKKNITYKMYKDIMVGYA